MARFDLDIGAGGLDAVEERVRALAAEIGTKYTMQIAGVGADDLDHLRWFDSGTRQQPARPALEVNARVRSQMLDAVRERVRADLARSGRINVLLALQAAAQAAREVWVERLQTNGSDIRFAPLSPRYLALKVRRGLDPRTGIATGAMLAALRRAQIIVKRA